MKLRSQLVCLALVALLPVVILATALGAFLINQQREIFRQGTEARVHALTTAVDSELRGSIDVLRSLANVRSIEERDLRYFRETAAQVLSNQDNWTTINLALPDGQQIMNLRAPAGQLLPMLPPTDESFASVVRTMQPAVGDLVVGPVTKEWDFAVRVPVVRKGHLRYIVSAVVKPESIARLIDSQGLPADWEGLVFDRRGRIVARTVQPGSIGKFVSEQLRMAVAASPSGWYRGPNLEGDPKYRGYRQSEATGWAFAMAIPTQAVDSAATRAVRIFGVSLAGAVLLAFGLAWFVWRRIAQPIGALAAATDRLVRGEDVKIDGSSRLVELRSLESGLRKAAEAQSALRKADAALKEADRAKDEFLAMLSHELRNPLAALTSAAHVLKVVPPAANEALQARGVIDRQTKHMARLLTDLLDVGRISAGKLAVRREPMNLGEAVTHAVGAMRSAGRLEAHCVYATDEAVWIVGDAVRVQQMATNLLDNAVKFTPPGGLIRVSARREGKQAVLEVADRGIGLAVGDCERVFHLFVQLGTGSGVAGGLGVGLALVKRLAELHDGSVSVASDGPGQGTTFTVRLPAVEEPTALAEHRNLDPQRSRKILIVEDNDAARQMLQATLDHGGHEVRAACDGRTGLALATEVRPDIALIDLSLPDMDGCEVARRLRALNGFPRITLVAVTGLGQASDQQRALAAGFDVHLVKPVAPGHLRQVIAGLR